MAIRQEAGANGLPTLVLTHRSGSTARVYLHGAHVTSWHPRGGGEALFLSRLAELDGRAPIRGGIPVVFPQFSDRGPLPKHGFVRTLPWRRVEVPGADADGTRLRLELRDTPESNALWPHPFRAELEVSLGEADLEVALTVENTGPETFSFTSALHTYLRVADVRRTRVRGLQGVRYVDQAGGGAERVEESPALSIEAETDRIYLDAPTPITVDDGAAGRQVRIGARGFSDAVVWNPWTEKAKGFPDFGDEEYLEMLCVEAARIGTPVELPPGGRWSGAQSLHAAETSLEEPRG